MFIKSVKNSTHFTLLRSWFYRTPLCENSLWYICVCDIILHKQYTDIAVTHSKWNICYTHGHTSVLWLIPVLHLILTAKHFMQGNGHKVGLGSIWNPKSLDYSRKRVWSSHLIRPEILKAVDYVETKHIWPYPWMLKTMDYDKNRDKQ